MKENQTNGRAAIASLLKQAFFNGLQAIDPKQKLSEILICDPQGFSVNGQDYRFADYHHIVVIGAGKACARMALALENILGDRICGGLIIVKDGHTETLATIQQKEAAHPVPNQAGILATEAMLQQLTQLNQHSLVICLLTGGASALLVAPVTGISLNDKQQLTQQLLKSGADIQTLNAVRQRLSRVKAGGLAQAVYPAHLLTLVMSDVIGDDPHVIASAPTLIPKQPQSDLSNLLSQWAISVPANVQAQLQAPPAVTSPMPTQQYHIFLNIESLLQAITQHLPTTTQRWPSYLQGDVNQQAAELANWAIAQWQQLAPGETSCLLAGGETTVTVTGQGTGGRNQQLALAFALAIASYSDITLLAAASDGSDGPTDASGAIVDGLTVPTARQYGLDAQVYLDENNSYDFFRLFDQHSRQTSHIMTGPTGINVMDIALIWLHKPVNAD